MANDTYFMNVRIGGEVGSLTLTPRHIDFQDSNSIGHQKWSLESIVESVVKPAICSVILKLEQNEDDVSKIISLRLTNLPDLARFRKVLSQRIKDQIYLLHKRKRKRGRGRDRADNVPVLMPFPDVCIKQEGTVKRMMRNREVLQPVPQVMMQREEKLHTEPNSPLSTNSPVARRPTTLAVQETGPLTNHSQIVSESDSETGTSIAEDELAALLSKSSRNTVDDKGRKIEGKHQLQDNTDHTATTCLEESETSMRASFAGSLCIEPSELSFLKSSPSSLQSEQHGSPKDILSISQRQRQRERRRGMVDNRGNTPLMPSDLEHHFTKQSSLTSLDERIPRPGLSKDRRKLRMTISQTNAAALKHSTAVERSSEYHQSPPLSPTTSTSPTGNVSALASTSLVNRSPPPNQHPQSLIHSNSANNPFPSTAVVERAAIRQPRLLPRPPGLSTQRSNAISVASTTEEPLPPTLASNSSAIPSLLSPYQEQQLSALRARRRATMEEQRLRRKSRWSLASSSHDEQQNDVEVQSRGSFHSLSLERQKKPCIQPEVVAPSRSVDTGQTSKPSLARSGATRNLKQVSFAKLSELEEEIVVAPILLEEDEDIVVAPMPSFMGKNPGARAPSRMTCKGRRSKKASFACDLTAEPTGVPLVGSSKPSSEFPRGPLQCLVSQQDQLKALDREYNSDIGLDQDDPSGQSSGKSLKLEGLESSGVFSETRTLEDNSKSATSEASATGRRFRGGLHASFAGDLAVEPSHILRKSSENDVLSQRSSLDMSSLHTVPSSAKVRASRERRELQKLASMMKEPEQLSSSSSSTQLGRPTMERVLSPKQVSELKQVQSRLLPRQGRPQLQHGRKTGYNASIFIPGRHASMFVPGRPMQNSIASPRSSLPEPNVARLSRERQELKKAFVQAQAQISPRDLAMAEDESSASESVSVSLTPAHRLPSNLKNLNRPDSRATQPGAERVSISSNIEPSERSQQLTATLTHGRPSLYPKISSLSSTSFSESQHQNMESLASIRTSQASLVDPEKGECIQSGSDTASDSNECKEEVSERDKMSDQSLMLMEDGTLEKELRASATTTTHCFDEPLDQGVDSDKKKSITGPPYFEETKGNIDIQDNYRPSLRRGSYMSCENLVEATVVDETADILRDSIFASAVEIDNEELHRKRRNFWVCTGFGLLIVGAALSLILVFSTPDAIGYQEKASITSEEHFRIIQEQVRGLVYNESSLDDVSSAATRALYWLAEKDHVYLDTNDFETVNMEKFAQRFYLAVFFFSQNEGSSTWEKCKPPETGENSACIHPVLESQAIEGEYHDHHMRNPAFRWLSDDECRWAGIRCDDGVHVSEIHIGGYNLSGTLPIELGQLRHLESLDLQQNRLQGHLPPEWGTLELALPALKSLRLDQNQITGALPNQWCAIGAGHLHSLILANNKLAGTLPPCLSELRTLEHLSVMHNSMTGTVPTELSKLVHLETLHLAGNSFSGSFPKSVCSLRDHNLFEASADCLDILDSEAESFVKCDCCTKCCDGTRDNCELRYPPAGPPPEFTANTTKR